MTEEQIIKLIANQIADGRNYSANSNIRTDMYFTPTQHDLEVAEHIFFALKDTCGIFTNISLATAARYHYERELILQENRE